MIIYQSEYPIFEEAETHYTALASSPTTQTTQRVRHERIGAVAGVLKEILEKDKSDPVKFSLDLIVERAGQRGITEGLSEGTVGSDIRIIRMGNIQS